MPFVSKTQQRYLFAKHPDVAREFASKTKDYKSLPEHKGKKDEKKAAMEREFANKKNINDNLPPMERRFAVKKTLNDSPEKTAMFTAEQVEKVASTLRKLPQPMRQKIASHAAKRVASYEALQRVFGYKSASILSKDYLIKVAWAQLLAALAPTAIDLGMKAFGGGSKPAAAAPGAPAPAPQQKPGLPMPKPVVA